MSLSTPEKLRTLQRKLYRKAKQEPGFRFYVLYDKVHRADILSHAYDLVRHNKGAPGVDGVTFAAIENGEGREGFLARLAEDLKEKRYLPQPVRRVYIPKATGGQRPLGIPTVRDRVAQMAAKLILEPIFEADFCDSSYGFRPRRSAHDAADAIADALRTDHTQVIDADLSKYFDTIPHAKLLAVVAERVADGAMLGLLKLWLKAPMMEEDEDGTRRNAGGGHRHGTPQGGVISPLLANLYLHLLDRLWERHHLERRYGAKLVRYADDLVILCRREPERPFALLQQVLGRLDLTLNAEKTRIVDAREGFDFLGFRFQVRKSRFSGKVYPHVEPTKRAQQRLRDTVRTLTERRLTRLPLPDIVGRLNRYLRGWSGYFHFRNSTGVFRNAKSFVEERVRAHLRKRHKLHSRAQGYQRFPAKVLYGRVGLFKLPTNAAWRTAHAL